MNTTTNTTTDTATRTRPVHQVRLGSIKAAVWSNPTDNGIRYNVTFCRIYKDKDGDSWKSTDSFGRDDLLVVAKVADQAHSWIHQCERKEAAAKPPTAEKVEVPDQ
jgi:hypothetical protein